MSEFSDYLENELLDHLMGKGEYTPPTVYVALSTADPTDDASGLSEPSDGYARVETEAADWNAASSGSIDNANDISFPEASGSWGTITHVALYDAATNGNMLGYSALDSSQAVASGEILKFAAGDLAISLD